jgi:hypothetical protein
MNKQNLQNEKLDRISRKLFKTARVPSSEIDRIIDSPELFEAIKTQIRIKQSDSRPKGIIGKWIKYPVWSWQTAGVALGILAIFLIGIASLIAQKESDTTNIADQTVAPNISLPTTALTETVQAPQYFERRADHKQNSAILSKSRNLSERTVLRSKVNHLPKPKPNPKILNRMPETKNPEEGGFYPLTFAGNLNDSEEELQILRVELPRASLVALGLILPVENEDAQIKTDLLVSSDGITRAIRLVK